MHFNLEEAGLLERGLNRSFETELFSCFEIHPGTFFASMCFGSDSQMCLLLSATHEIVLYVYLQRNSSGVDFLLYKGSRLLRQVEFSYEVGLLRRG